MHEDAGFKIFKENKYLRVSRCLARIVSESLISGNRNVQRIINKNTDELFFGKNNFFVVVVPCVICITEKILEKARV